MKRQEIGRLVVIQTIYYESGEIKKDEALIQRLEPGGNVPAAPGITTMTEYPNTRLNLDECAVWMCSSCHQRCISHKDLYLPKCCPECGRKVLNGGRMKEVLGDAWPG